MFPWTIDLISLLTGFASAIGVFALVIVLRLVWKRRRSLPSALGQTVMATLPSPLLVVDLHGIILAANTPACRLFGRPDGELVGTSVTALGDTSLSGPIEQLLREGSVRDHEVTLNHATDGSRLLGVSASVIYDEDHRPTAYVCIGRDITARKRAEQQARLFADIVENIEVGLTVWHVEGLDDPRSLRLVSINPTASRYLNLPQDQPLGRRMEELFPNLYKTTVPRELVNVVSSGKSRDLQDLQYSDVGVAAGIFTLKAFPLPNHCVGLSFENVTEARMIDQALKESEERFRLLVDGVRDYAILMLDPAGYVISWNPGAERIHGYPAPEIIGRHFSVFYSPDDVQMGTPEDDLRGAMDGGRAEQEGWRLRKDGSRFWASSLTTALYDRGGFLRGFAQMTRDISERRTAEEALRASETKFRRLVDANIIGFMLVDAQGRILETNDALLKMLGYSRDDLQAGIVGGQALTPPEYSHVDQWMKERLKATSVCPPVEKEYVRKDGSRLPVLVGVVVLDRDQERSLCFVIDASERRAAQDALIKAYDQLELRVRERTQDLEREILKREHAEEALRNLAITDALTGLLNRRGFLSAAEDRLKQTRLGKKRAVLFMVDLDNLKPINDTFGHLEGDHAINAAAQLLKETFRPSDIVARIGGDEFAILAGEEEGLDAQILLEQLYARVDAHNLKKERPYDVTMSVGWLRLDPRENFILEQLMHRADTSLYEQKSLKKTRDQTIQRRII